MLNSFQNTLPRRLLFGRGASDKLPQLLKELGVEHPVIVTDDGVVKAQLLARITAVLDGSQIPYVVFADVQPEPPFGCVDQARSALGTTVDGVVGLGGGSVMDVAKVLAAVAVDGRDVRSLAGSNKVVTRQLPVVMLPTTAGTGSEATPVAVFTNEATGGKVGVVDPCLVPDAAIIDPVLTDSLPRGATAAAGIDALIHAIEAYIAKVATPLARGMALEAARRIGPALPAVFRDLTNREARDAMAIGSNLAGVAFANSSCCAVHALALPVGGRFHIPHGILTGGLAAAVMQRNAPVCGADFAALAQALGWDPQPTRFAVQLAALADEVGVSAGLRRTPLPRNALAEMAAEAVANQRLMAPNPAAITVAEAIRIYEETLCIA